mgnify:CR=1 FL=1
MAKIEIFESEINDGLADKIAASAEAGIKFNKKINPESLRVQKPDSLINFLARASSSRNVIFFIYIFFGGGEDTFRWAQCRTARGCR